VLQQIAYECLPARTVQWPLPSMAMKKFLLLLLPVLVALAAHYHRQGSLTLPPQLVGPAEELWQQLRVHLPLHVPVSFYKDSSAHSSSSTSGTSPQVCFLPAPV
jgi:hypothetical protein